MAKRKQTTEAATGRKTASRKARTSAATSARCLGRTRSGSKSAAMTRYWPAGSRTIRANGGPKQVKQNLSNVKSVLRQAQRKKPGTPKKESRPAEPTAAVAAAPRKGVRGLESLEEQIDECMTLAKNLDREGLSSVINLLRRARNEVVWKMGE